MNNTGSCEAFYQNMETAKANYDNGQSIIGSTTSFGRDDSNDVPYATLAVLKINQCAAELENRGYTWATARPSSYHPGCVVSALCDGSCRTISDTVEPLAFRQAMCPNDKKTGITSNYSISELD